MKQVSMKLVHLLLSFFYLTLSGGCLMNYLSLAQNLVRVELSIDLFVFPFLNFGLGFDASPSSLLFIRVVSLITSVVLIFSYSYIGVNFQAFIFLLLLNLFVLSIMLVITIKSLFMVILGWDGLGVISFFLILFYQSPYRVFSAWFTILINRLGDRFLILSIILMWFTDVVGSVFNFYNSAGDTVLVIFLISGLITKRALFPFSPWLPIAIRAPTPISRLVHSSTLVTAGLYLIIRLEPVYIGYESFADVIMWVSVFTSFYAGVSALVESDLKKLVALSTLRHLGFIGISFFSGYTVLAYFHLLAHALFKRLLFIGVGDWISVGHHYQDSRALSSGIKLTPLSSLVIITSLISLIGLPFIVGFYSKDIVLESLLYSNLSIFILRVVYVNVFLTYCYTIRVLVYIVRSFLQSSPYFLSIGFQTLHFVIISLLRRVSLVFPRVYFYSSGVIVIQSQPLLHWIPLAILLRSLLLKLSGLMNLSSYSYSSAVWSLKEFTLSQILLIRTLYTSGIRIFMVSLFSRLNKSLELGALNNLSQYFYVDGLKTVGHNYYYYSLYFLPVVILTTLSIILVLCYK